VGFYHRFFACPHYCYDSRFEVHCDCGKIVVSSTAVLKHHIAKYCTSATYWRSCSLAQAAELQDQAECAEEGDAE